MASKLKPFEVPQSILDTPGAFPVEASDLQTVGTSAPQSLSAAVRSRKDEFTRKRTIKVKVGSWNVGSLSGTDKDLGLWFVKGLGVKGLSEGMAQLQRKSTLEDPADSDIETVEDQENRRRKRKPTVPANDKPAVPHDDEVGLYVLGLQEVIDISSVTEAIKPYTDPNPAKKWKAALRSCLPKGYEKVAEHQLLGLLILVFAAPEVKSSISNVSATSVGTGLGGYLGNKGAVSVRIVLGESTRMTFVNCHLAAGADNASLHRRIWDTNQIVQRTRFAGVSLDGEEDGPEEKLGDEDFAFWFGDLNYRLDDIPGEDVRRLLLLHTRNEYDILNKSKQKIDGELGYRSASEPTESSNTSGPLPVPQYEYSQEELPAAESQAEPDLDPSTDPASLLTTLNSLLVHDQLHAQQRQRMVFHDGWREGPINFLPTYKYDVGSVGMFDSGEKKRSPSWCDRILFRTKVDRLMYEERAAKEAQARQKDEDMKKRGLDAAQAEQDVLFNYDPDTDGVAYNDDYDEDGYEMHDAELVQTHGDRDDEISLEHYLSHQRVLSSDHKPIDAVFSVTYDSVIPELKQKIHAEVARELDKAENEARPTITVVTENQHSDDDDTDGDSAKEAASTDNINTRTAPEVNSINFGSIRYDIPKTRSITVANTGQLPCTFTFIGRDATPTPSTQANTDTSSISPTWLSISTLPPSDPDAQSYALPNTNHSLDPGETLTLYLTAHITPVLAPLVAALNASQTSLDDVLILRVASGRDHFLPLRGTWLPTCFHRSLEELVVASPATAERGKGGVRAMPRARNNRDGTGRNSVLNAAPSVNALVGQVSGGRTENADGEKGQAQQQGRDSAPRELFALTEAVQTLAERAVVDWDMVHPGEAAPWTGHEGATGAWPFEETSWTMNAGEQRDELKGNVREALDTASSISEALPMETECIVRLEVVAETLLAFLGSLRNGVVTADMFANILGQVGQPEKDSGNRGRAADRAEEVNMIVMDALSTKPVHSVSFTFVTFLSIRLLEQIYSTSRERGRTSSSSITQPTANVQVTSDGASSMGAGAGTMRSRASTMTSEVGSEISTTPSNDVPNDDGAEENGGSKRRGFFSKLASRARRRAGSNVSGTTASPGGNAGVSGIDGTDGANKQMIERRRALCSAYATVLGPLIICGDGAARDASQIQTAGNGNEKESAKARKALLARKAAIMEAVLIANGA
jgi:inositol polyphosphate 5-phosphatase INPP5B/F